MASTRNLWASAKFTKPFLGNQPISIGSGDEPALTAANLTKQTILGPPFDWRWNRTEVVIPFVVGQQDYVIPAPQFGHLSRVTLLLADGTVKEIGVQTSLSRETMKARPSSAAAQYDDGQGNVTVRFNLCPEAAYSAVVLYQHKALPMTSLAATWAPIPDELSFIYEWGFFAILSMLVKDARMPIFRQMFLSHLLGAQDGLDATKRNIFLGNWLDVVAEAARKQTSVSQGAAARQM